MSIYLMRQRHRTQRALHRSRQSLQMKLKDLNLSKQSIRIPSPTYRKPMLYPGRLWRLEWGDMEEPLNTPEPRYPRSESTYTTNPRSQSVTIIPHELMAAPQEARLSYSTVESLPISSPLPAYSGPPTPASPPPRRGSVAQGSAWF